jgi:hypothetical protein
MRLLADIVVGFLSLVGAILALLFLIYVVSMIVGVVACYVPYASDAFCLASYR